MIDSKLIDPITGLPLTEVTPAPASRRVEDVMTVQSPIDNQMGQTPPPVAPAPDPRSVPAESKNRPAGRVSILDGLVFALLGKPEQMQSDEEKAKASQSRKEAGNMAAAAAENPGEQFMGIPSGGGGSGTKLLSDLVRLFGGGGAA